MEPFSLIGGAITLASKFAPYLIRKLKGEKAAETAEEVFEIAKAATGAPTPDKAMEMIESNPETALKFKEAIIEYEKMVIQEDTKRLDITNQTMRIEYETKGKWKTGWRPYWGWVSGTMFGYQMFMFSTIGLISIISGAKSGKLDKAVEVIKALALLAGALASTWMLALFVLGVAVHSRSKDKQNMTGIAQPLGLVQMVLSKFLKN